MKKYPRLTVDIIIECQEGIVLIERKNPPYGWALPGGFVEYGETTEASAIREAKEETSLGLKNLKQFHVYSSPMRDPRGHTISVVFTASATGIPNPDSDAKNTGVFTKDSLPHNIAFDHRQILNDYFKTKHPAIVNL
jgi:ADP-ribose pyrophosphatase YjhB (NUDIX family)